MTAPSSGRLWGTADPFRLVLVTSECPSSEILAAFLDHALTPEERELVERHLVECRQCREILRSALPPEDPSPFV